MNPLLLLTGPPGIGKTTALRRACERLSIAPLRGFYTEEVRSGGVCQGFRLVTFDGKRRVLAPDPAVRLFVIHEIGKMECLSAEFVSAVDNLLALGRPLLATVALSSEGLIERINRDPRVRLVQLTHAIGDEAPGEIVDALKRWDAEATAGRPNPDSPNRPDGE